MAEPPATNKPDFRDGFPIRDLRDGGIIWPRSSAILLSDGGEVLRDN